MSDRFIDSGILVVYDRGEQFFHRKSSALKFSESMEATGKMCEHYVVTIEGGKVTKRRWVRPEALRSERPQGRIR